MDNCWGSVIVLLSTLILVFGSKMFLHEPSRVIISPGAAINSDFGFSIAYQDKNIGNLLVGAPHSGNVVGDVFVCPIGSILYNKPRCTPVITDLANLAPETEYDFLHPNQTFCLGASIAATPDYFVSCAPLWPTKVLTKKIILPKTVGICFIYKETATTRFKGMVEKYNNKRIKDTEFDFITDLLRGEIGWSAYYDKTDQNIIFGKPSDIIYLKASIINMQAKSMRNDVYRTSKTSLHFGAKINSGKSITSGNFLADKDESFYVAAMQNQNLGGEILFIKNNREENALKMTDISISGPRTAMYGMAVLSSDVNKDGFADLLVGAPAFTRDPQSYETGAFYIYLGGDKKIGDITRQFSLYGTMDGSRFGAALASSDIDGDGLPEIFVSAPYEKFENGKGALYVLSGSEIQDIIQTKQYKVNVNDLKHVQKIKVTGLDAFGYSLQVVQDIDSNGCNELAVGAPGSATVVLLRCIPRINVTLSLSLSPASKSKQDIVNVCINVTYPLKPEKIMTKLKLVCDITGNGASILGRNEVEVDLASRSPQYCNEITVQYLYEESLLHTFIAKLDFIELEKEFSQDYFNIGWVTVSQYSKTEVSLDITKPCLDSNNCEAQLEGFFLWSNHQQPASDIEYKIGQNKTENVTLVVINKGVPSFGCVQLKINAPASIPCARDGIGGYLCNLKPIERDQQQTIIMVVKMNEFNNKDTLLKLTATWYPRCQMKTAFNSTELNIRLTLVPEVYVNSSSHYLNITEKEITNQETLNDTTNMINDNHEYTITNENLVNWINVPAEIRMNAEPFISSYKITSTPHLSVCNSTQTINETLYHCSLNLKSRSTLKLIITADILKTKLGESLKNKAAVIVSNFTLRLSPSDVELSKDQTTIILIQKEAYVRDNKQMIIIIAIICGLLILGLIIYILYRFGFFERDAKKQLETMKESIKRRKSQDSKSHENSLGEDENEEDDIKMSAKEDFDFELVSLNQCYVDTSELIKSTHETEADVHEEKFKENKQKDNRHETSKSLDKEKLI